MKEEVSLIGLESSFQNPDSELNKALFYRKLSRGALLAMAIFLLIQFGLILVNEFSKGLQKKMTHWNAVTGLRNDENLFGVQENKVKKRPEWTFRTMLSGEWQKQFEQWFNTKMIPFRSTLIKLHNQFFYTVFLKSYMYSGGIVVGKQRYLYEMQYITKYYNVAHGKYTQETFNTWADELQTLADFFRQRGQQFIYIITPSKASYQPEYLPVCRRCDPSNTRPDYYGFTNTLKKRGFKFIDASQMVLDAKKDFEPFMFPKGGIHWTSLAGAFATRNLIKEIATKYPVPELQFTYRLDQKPREIDMDLAGLLNVFARPRHYLVPEVVIKPMPRKTKQPLKVAIVSGSFMFEVAGILAKTKLFDQIDFYFYWKVEHYRNTPKTELEADSIIGTLMPFEALRNVNLDDPRAHDDILSDRL